MTLSFFFHPIHFKKILNKQDSNFEGFESDEERFLDDKTIGDIKNQLPQSTDRTCLDKFLDHIPSKWKNYVVRSIFTLFMVFGFFTFIYLGPLALAGIVSTQFNFIILSI